MPRLCVSYGARKICCKRSWPCTRLLIESSLGLCNISQVGWGGVGVGCVDTWGLTCEECCPVWSCVSHVMALVVGVD